MAAGLTIAEDKIAALADFLEGRLASAVTRSRDGAALMLDCAVAPRGVSVDLAETLDGAGPYGSGWPSPRVAAGPFGVVSCDRSEERRVGKECVSRGRSRWSPYP